MQLHGPHLASHNNIKELCRSLSSYLEPEVTSCSKKPKEAARTDKLGNPIKKGAKYKVTFRDEVVKEAQVWDLHVVENWKELNFINGGQEHSSCCKYSCSLY